MLKIKDKYDYRKELCDALKSGKYKHGKGMMFNSDNQTYCVLGVLAKISGMEIAEDGVVLKDHPLDGYQPLISLLGLDGAFDLYKQNDYNTGFKAAINYLENLP